MSARKVRVVIDCGTAGRVSWELPSQMVKTGLTDDQIITLTHTAWGHSIKIFFTLIFSITGMRGSAMEFGMSQLDYHMKELARLLLRRM